MAPRGGIVEADNCGVVVNLRAEAHASEAPAPADHGTRGEVRDIREVWRWDQRVAESLGENVLEHALLVGLDGWIHIPDGLVEKSRGNRGRVTVAKL